MVETKYLRASVGNIKEVDRISMLPDELIHRIMSFIDTRYAVQASVLSKRWIHIWKSLPFLNFDMYGCTLDMLRNNVIDRVFMLRDDCDIHWFRLSRCRWYYFDELVSTSPILSRWIDVAVRRNVQEVKLELYQAPLDFSYEIPRKLLNCKSLKKLTLLSCDTYVIIVLPKSMSLPQLEYMCLRGIIVLDAELAKRLFSSCPLLEILKIVNCDIQTDNQKNFTVVSTSLKKFTYLHQHGNNISYCGREIKPKIIMLSAPNLTKFAGSYSDHYQHLSMEEKEVNAICMTKLLVAVDKVQQLRLSAGLLHVLKRATNLLNCQLHCLCNLQRLSLQTWLTGGSLRIITSLLTISPNIKTLILKLNGPNLVDDGDDLELGFSLPGLLSHLNVVRIEEMVGCEAELKLVRFLLKNAKVLKKVVLLFASSDNFLDTVRKVEKFNDRLKALPRASSNIKKDVDLTFADNNLKILM